MMTLLLGIMVITWEFWSNWWAWFGKVALGNVRGKVLED